MTEQERIKDRGDGEAAFKAGSVWSPDGTLVKGNDYLEAEADDAMWEEAFRTGKPIEAPPGYDIVETEMGVAGGAERRDS